MNATEQLEAAERWHDQVCSCGDFEGHLTPPPTGPQTFKYYLHDNYTSSERREYMEKQGVRLSEDAWEDLGRPFYEVTLECEVDAQGTVSLIKASL